MIATPVGLFLGACFAALSTLEIGGARSLAVLRHERLLRAGLLAVLAGWAVWSLASAPPLDRPLPPKDATGPLVGFAVAGGALYAFAAWRYLELYRRRHGFLLVAITVAWILLTEALIAVAQALAELSADVAQGGGISSRAREVAEEFPLPARGRRAAGRRPSLPALRPGRARGPSPSRSRRRRAGRRTARGQRPVRRPAGIHELQRTLRSCGRDRDAATGRPEWPRFRAGVSGGPALMGNVGTPEQRSFAAIGDTTNVAARLQAAASPGQVVVDADTAAALGDDAVLESLGELELEGRSQPVRAFGVTRLG